MLKWILLLTYLSLFLSGIQSPLLASSGQVSNANTVSTTWCLNQVEKVAKKENECRSELSKTRIDLEKAKGKRDGLVEKLGIYGLGVVAVYSNFNPLVLVAEAWLLIFQ